MRLTPDTNVVADFPTLKAFKTHTDAILPIWGTDHAACFDLAACLVPGQVVKGFTVSNGKFEMVVGLFASKDEDVDVERWQTPSIVIQSGERLLVPTGLIFDIPNGYSVRLHSRSGLALKQGLVLANHEGVIDSDYIDPTFVMLTNTSRNIQYIFHGDRIAQGEMIRDYSYSVEETFDKPVAKTNRTGGFGSTGV